jgi:hypothetical protein
VLDDNTGLGGGNGDGVDGTGDDGAGDDDADDPKRNAKICSGSGTDVDMATGVAATPSLRE